MSYSDICAFERRRDDVAVATTVAIAASFLQAPTESLVEQFILERLNLDEQLHNAPIRLPQTLVIRS